MQDSYSQEEYNKIINSNPKFKEVVNLLNKDFELSMRKIAHELGNVLTLVNSSLQIIESSHPEVHDFKYWDSTTSDIHYLISLVSEISLLNNSNKLNLTETNLTNLVNSVIISFNSHFSNTSDFDSCIQLSCDISDNVPLITGDETKLKQVIINLTKNALEAFTPSILTNKKYAIQNPYVLISLKYENNKIILSVEDNGCGMDDETLSTIFTPMVSYKENGSGLGLPISQKIILAHNGTLTVNSDPGKGTVFTIILPV